ncbi:hypothetical protein VNO78_26486 [Psophocarpus tetragonolobus]|uniref:Uncharacterized protein n=1 Tax=Psophocarpus tetragonolobus TaxID=3891 RepID=A0AAN9RZR5_PSOTE
MNTANYIVIRFDFWQVITKSSSSVTSDWKTWPSSLCGRDDLDERKKERKKERRGAWNRNGKRRRESLRVGEEEDKSGNHPPQHHLPLAHSSALVYRM